MDEMNLDKNKRDFSGYQVVRQEFVSGADDVTVTFNRGRFYINSVGLNQFPDKDYIQILVDKDTKSLVIKPSKRKKRDSFLWCSSGKKRKPRRMKCIPLYYLIYQMMNWDINARYQIRGTIEDYGECKVIFTDLRDAICYVRTENDEDRAKYQMHLPEEWQKNFGMPIMDYENRTDIKTFDEAVVFDVEFMQNEKKKKQMAELKENMEEEYIQSQGEETDEKDE